MLYGIDTFASFGVSYISETGAKHRRRSRKFETMGGRVELSIPDVTAITRS